MGIARAVVSIEVLKDMLTKGKINSFRVIEGIPEDAEIINGEYDPITKCYYLDVEHPDFEDFSKISILAQTL